MKPRLLLFAATTGYQIRAFSEAARRLGVELTLATDRCHVLDDPWGDQALPVRFDDPESAPRAVAGCSFDAVVAVGDRPALAAARAAKALRIRFHPPVAVEACGNKFLARHLLEAAGLPVPYYFLAALDQDPRELAGRAPFPCVLKPVALSASRGVIRTNDAGEFAAAFARLRTLLEKSPDIQVSAAGQHRSILVESYIPGAEFAVEGLMTEGRLKILALFDKPDPLEGPFFEETIYTTPSRENAATQAAIRETVERAACALGLWHGPLHAELRVNHQGVWMLEAAARPIGGLCAQVLRFGDAMPLEELIVRHALGQDVSGAQLFDPASGVMMIPIPQAGIYEEVSGIEEAQAVPGVEEVVITAKPGQHLLPLPEGSSYLGFIFARASAPDQAERALRQAHAALRFGIRTALPTLSP